GGWSSGSGSNMSRDSQARSRGSSSSYGGSRGSYGGSRGGSRGGGGGPRGWTRPPTTLKLAAPPPANPPILSCAGPPRAAGAASAPASAAGEHAQDLAKKLANPVSDMVSIPFQFNWENGVGPDDGLRTVLNIQPVLPVPIRPKWNMIERWIMPYVSQPEALGSRSGLSDVTFSSFFSPSGSSRLVWGAGPVVVLPVPSDPPVGRGPRSEGSS